MQDLVTALGLVLVIEGALYALMPDQMRKVMALALGEPSGRLRGVGVIAVVVGITIVWAVRRLS